MSAVTATAPMSSGPAARSWPLRACSALNLLGAAVPGAVLLATRGGRS